MSKGQRLNRVIWNLIDDRHGETYRSIKTDVPRDWTREIDKTHGWITYICGEYEIERWPYGKGWTFHAKRQTCPVGGWGYARLKDAKAACEKNARGEEMRHFA